MAGGSPQDEARPPGSGQAAAPSFHSSSRRGSLSCSSGGIPGRQPREALQQVRLGAAGGSCPTEPRAGRGGPLVLPPHLLLPVLFKGRSRKSRPAGGGRGARGRLGQAEARGLPTALGDRWRPEDCQPPGGTGRDKGRLSPRTAPGADLGQTQVQRLTAGPTRHAPAPARAPPAPAFPWRPRSMDTVPSASSERPPGPDHRRQALPPRESLPLPLPCLASVALDAQG